MKRPIYYQMLEQVEAAHFCWSLGHAGDPPAEYLARWMADYFADKTAALTAQRDHARDLACAFEADFAEITS